MKKRRREGFGGDSPGKAWEGNCRGSGGKRRGKEEGGELGGESSKQHNPV